MIRKEAIEAMQSRFKFIIYKAGEHIAADQLFEKGIALCSHCGYPLYLDQRRCDHCMQSKFILKESTVNEIEEYKKLY